MLSIYTDSVYRLNWVGLYRSPNNPEKWIWSVGERAPIDHWDSEQPNNDSKNCGGLKLATSKLHNIPCSETLS